MVLPNPLFFLAALFAKLFLLIAGRFQFYKKYKKRKSTYYTYNKERLERGDKDLKKKKRKRKKDRGRRNKKKDKRGGTFNGVFLLFIEEINHLLFVSWLKTKLV